MTMTIHHTSLALPTHKKQDTLVLDDANIPLFDLQKIITASGKERADLVRSFGDGLRDFGFIAIKATEITPLIDQVTSLMRRYFHQPLAIKMLDDHNNNYQTGFWPPGMETAAGSSTEADNKETYFISPDYKKWPALSCKEESNEFKSVMTQYQKHLTGYAATCMRLISEYLGENTEELSRSMTSAHNLLRLAYYPASTSKAPGAGAHYDLNALTLLPPSSKGLRLLTKAGQWKFVTVPKGYLIVNTGQQLERKTAGLIRATLHEVMKPPELANQDRFASIFFASWSSKYRLKPFESCMNKMTQNMTESEKARYRQKYPDVNVEENLLSRLIEMGSILDPAEGLVRGLHAKGLLQQPTKALRQKYPDLFGVPASRL